jgi:hypothetical protein
MRFVADRPARTQSIRTAVHNRSFAAKPYPSLAEIHLLQSGVTFGGTGGFFANRLIIKSIS